MSQPVTVEPSGQRRRISVGVIATAFALLALAGVGVALVFRFVEAERARDLRAWQLRLGTIADSRKAAVDAWLRRQWEEVGGIAENESVRLLLTQVKLAGGDLSRVPDGAGQAEYLENLLAATADRAGFKAPVLGPEVPANVQRVGLAGMAILDMDGHAVVVVRGTPVSEAGTRTFLAASAKAARSARDIYLDPAGKPAMAFLAPIYAVQGDAVPDQQVGWALGIKEVDHELYPLLKQPGVAEATAAAELVRREGAVVEFLSSLDSGTQPLSVKLAMNTPDLAAAAALEAPGGFGLKRDERDREVLFTSRAIEGMPWVLIYKIDAAEALADTDRRGRRLLTMLLLGLLLLTAGIVAIWRHGASKRASDAASRYRALAARFEAQGNFLRLVTDSQPNAIFITDEGMRYRFVNRKSAEEAGISPSDMIGKTLAAVLGPDAAKRYQRLNRLTLEDAKPMSAVHRVGTGRAMHVVQSQHIPLAPTPDIPRGVLVVEEDITGAVMERERHERTLSSLVRSLVTLVDRRDRYAAHHSVRVALVARAIGEEMGLDPVLVDTAETAGNLMNIGKILVPPDILAKNGSLSEAEMEQVRASIGASADFLEGIEFEGPVVETLRQCQEHWDGSGRPRGLKDEAILPTARVVAVANAFVAMVSPRAHRPGLNFDAAVAALFHAIGTRFDRGAVAALVNYLDNKGGRAAWAEFATLPRI
jgi:PAS domain S-box-containing protein